MALVVPVIPGLCSSQANLDTWTKNVNLALSLTLKAVNESLGVEFKLPGIPPLQLPGLGAVRFPETPGRDYFFALSRTPAPSGFVGNRFKIREQRRPVIGWLKGQGNSELLIPGTSGVTVPGVDPSTLLINWINTNYQILAEQLATEGVDWQPIPIPVVSLCEDPQDPAESGIGGGSQVGPGQGLVNDLINANGEAAEEAAGGGVGCVSLVSSTPIVGGVCWEREFDEGATALLSISPTFSSDTNSFQWDYSGPGSNTFGPPAPGSVTALEHLEGFSNGQDPAWESSQSSVADFTYHGAPCQFNVCAGDVSQLKWDWSLNVTFQGFFAGGPDNFANFHLQVGALLWLVTPTTHTFVANIGPLQTSSFNSLASSPQVESDSVVVDLTNASGAEQVYGVAFYSRLVASTASGPGPGQTRFDWHGTAQASVSNFRIES